MSYYTTTSYTRTVPSSYTTTRVVHPYSTTRYVSSSTVLPTRTYYTRSVGYSFRTIEPKEDDPSLAWFNAVDKDGSGNIDASELAKALKQGGYDFSLGLAEKMIRMFDDDGSGTIERKEYQKLIAFVESMKAAFMEKDSDNSGTLESDEVRRALKDSGYELRDGTFRNLMQKYDPERHGGLKLDDYIALTLLLGTASKEFQRFEVQTEEPGEDGERKLAEAETTENKEEEPPKEEGVPVPTAMFTFDDYLDSASKF